MHWVVQMLNFSRDAFGTLSEQSKKSLHRAAAWIEKKTLQIKHVSTLERFHNKEYGHKDDTIDVAKAFNKGLLDPQALLSSLLATQIDRLTDKNVLNSWNQVTLEAMQSRPDGSRPPGAIPLNAVLRNAAYRGDCETLEWLVHLKNPTEPLHWDSRLLLMHNAQTARWALLGHSDLMNVPDPAYFIRTSVEPNGEWLPPNWLNHRDRPKFRYDQDRELLLDLRYYLNHLMDTYFKEMPWQERWANFANPLTPVSPVEPTIRSDGVQGLAQGHAIISGILKNAPMEVQKCLAAFKNSRHPKEDPNPSVDIEPKAIRQTFFGGPACPVSASPAPALASWLGLMQGMPPNEAADAWVQWQTSVPALVDDTSMVLPSGVFETP